MRTHERYFLISAKKETRSEERSALCLKLPRIIRCAQLCHVLSDTMRYRANNFLRLASVNLKKSNVRYITILQTDQRERLTKSEESPYKSPTYLLESRDVK